MPMGIANAPFWFQRFIDRVLSEFEVRKTLIVYMDDILVFTPTLLTHYEEVASVLAKLEEKNLKVSSKSQLVKKSIEFLGHFLDNGEIKPLPNRAEFITNMLKPRTLVELQRLMGIANYSRAYIPMYSELVRPLYELMKVKDVPQSKRKKKNGAIDGKKIILEWTEEAEKAYEKLKEVMSSDLALSLPNFEHPFILNSDASDYAYGEFLEQIIERNSKIIAYFSKCYTAAQKNYATPKKELLSIVMSVEHWKSFLYGNKFTVYTDHQPLAWLLNKKNPRPRLERWMMRLAQYQFEIKYRKGDENIVADALSRLPEER
jgi:hypothetical protein